MTETKKLMGILPVHVGQRVKFTQAMLPPYIVPETRGEVIGIELRAGDVQFFYSTGAPANSVTVAGCLALRFLPLAVSRFLIFIFSHGA